MNDLWISIWPVVPHKRYVNCERRENQSDLCWIRSSSWFLQYLVEISSWCFYLRIYVQIDWFLSKRPGYDFTHSSWPHWMKTLSAFLVLWRGIRRSPVDSLCIRSSDVPFDASHNKLFYKQSRGRLIDPSHKFYNALDKYLIMHHLVKM